jgi:hypothetical protein
MAGISSSRSLVHTLTFVKVAFVLLASLGRISQAWETNPSIKHASLSQWRQRRCLMMFLVNAIWYWDTRLNFVLGQEKGNATGASPEILCIPSLVSPVGQLRCPNVLGLVPNVFTVWFEPVQGPSVGWIISKDGTWKGS